MLVFTSSAQLKLVKFTYREDVNKPKNEQRFDYRPCLVLEDDIITPIAQITKHEPRIKTDYKIKDYKGAGLKLPSTIRFGQTLKVNENTLKKIVQKSFKILA